VKPVSQAAYAILSFSSRSSDVLLLDCGNCISKKEQHHEDAHEEGRGDGRDRGSPDRWYERLRREHRQQRDDDADHDHRDGPVLHHGHPLDRHDHDTVDGHPLHDDGTRVGHGSHGR
jgi:hypothetical protein